MFPSLFMMILALTPAPAPAPTLTQVSLAQNDSSQDYIIPHNEARAAVGVGNIVWNEGLAAYAQQYANQRVNDCALIHSGGPYGENLAWGRDDWLTGTTAVQLWVDEKDNYDYTTNTCVAGKACEHYTQVVWRNSIRLGCARVQCNDNKGTFVICSYAPPGNVIGERPY